MSNNNHVDGILYKNLVSTWKKWKECVKNKDITIKIHRELVDDISYKIKIKRDYRFLGFHGITIYRISFVAEQILL